jgi:hypothetical protein
MQSSFTYSATPFMGDLSLIMIGGKIAESAIYFRDCHFFGENTKIPATVWYRFQRLVEETSAVCLIFTPWPMVSPAQTRVAFHSTFSLETLEKNTDEFLDEIKLEISDRRQPAETANFLQNSA